ncbi:hypothetical protein ACOME3_006527 [Neoechinorhynchus agilis]
MTWRLTGLYVMEPSGTEVQQASITHDENSLMYGRFWSTRVLIPAIDQNGRRFKSELRSRGEYKLMFTDKVELRDKIKSVPPRTLLLETVAPIWDNNAFILRYGNRVLYSSAKNFQLHDKSGVIVFRLGKVCSQSYLCDIGYPMSVIQGFGCALGVLEGNMPTDWQLIVPN